MPRRKPADSASASSGSRALKIVLFSGIGLVVLVFVAAFAVIGGIKGWLKSDKFRHLVETKAAIALKSDTTLAPFRWDGNSSVYADQFEALGFEDAGIAVIRAESIRADLGSVTGQVVAIPEISANRFYLEISDDRQNGNFERSPAGLEAETRDTTAVASAPSWISARVPNRAEVEAIRISQFGLRINEDTTDKLLLRDVSLEAKPMTPGDLSGWDIDGRNGKLLIADVPELDVDEFALRWRGEELFVTHSAFSVFDGGRLTAKGRMTFGEPGEVDLDLVVKGIDTKEVLDSKWHDQVRGVIGGDIAVNGPPKALIQSGTLTLTEGQISAIPVLDTIATYTKQERFKRLVLHEAKTDFVQSSDGEGGDRLDLTHLVIQSDGLCRVEGDAVIVGGSIEGRFQVGVTPGTLRWIPGAERKVFTRSEGGFLWTEVNVSGPTDAPKEDLTARLITGAVESMVEGAPEEVIKGVQGVLNGESPANTSDLLNEGKKALQGLVPLLGQ